MTLALRAFSLAFLAWHAGLLFPGLADPWVMAGAAIAGLFGGAALRRWRWLPAWGLGAVIFLVVDLLLTVLPSWVSGSAPSVLDTLPLWADRQLVFAALPFALGWLQGWAFTDRPSLRGGERLVNAALVVAVFWTQGPYHVTLYPHPLALAAVFGLFLASELMLLAARPPRQWPKLATLLVALLGVAFLWSLLGRYEDQSTASGGGLMKPDLFQFDFAPLVRLEDEITLGDNLVLLYREEGTPQTRYLRRMVLDDYDASRGFSVSGGKPPVVGRRALSFPPLDGLDERTPVRQEYYLVNLDPSSLLGLNEPVTVTPYAQWNRSSFVNAYRVDSLVAGDQFWLYNDAEGDGLSPEERRRYTVGGDDPEIRELALAMTKGAQTRFEKATSILLALKDHYYYSLKPGNPGSRGALKHFLFEGKKGYCSYFAFSMALLLRSLDIPARIAVGFATNPDDAVLGFTPVRAFQAHAWVEVPFDDYGWLEFDPTSATPAPGEPFQFPQASDPDALSKLIAEILEARPQPLAENAAPVVEASGNPWSFLWSWGFSWLPTLVVFLLVLGNEAWRHRWRLGRWATRDERKRVALRWRELVQRAHRARVGPTPDQTPEAWASQQTTHQESWRALAQDVSRARYSPFLPPGWEARVAARTTPLGRELDRSRSWFHRVASLLFPWWPA